MKQKAITILILLSTCFSLSAQEIIPASKNGKWGFIDTWGNEVVPFIYDDAQPFNYAKRAEVKLNNKWGLINKAGKTIVPCKYDEIISWDDLFFVRRGNKWGQVDKQGKFVIQLQCDTILIEDNISIAKCNGKYSAYYKAKQIVPLEYDSLDTRFSYRHYIVAQKDGKYGLIDTLGQAIIPIKYDKVNFDWRRDGYFEVTMKNGDYFYTNPVTKDSLSRHEYYRTDPYVNGYKVVSQKDCDIYENWAGENTFGKRFHTARPFSEGIAIVTNFDLIRQGIDTLGNVIFDVPKGLYVYPFSDGFADCFDEKTKQKGIIDRKGKLIVEPVFDYVYYEGKYFSAGKDGGKSLYDTAGNLLKYSKVRKLDTKGMFFVEYNEKWGYADSLFCEVIPTIYDYIDSPSEGLMKVRYKGKCGFIDETGNEVIPFIYDEADSFNEGWAIVKYKGKYGTIDKKNRYKVKFEYDRIKRGVMWILDILKDRTVSHYYPNRQYKNEIR